MSHKNNVLFYNSPLLGFVKYGVEYNSAMGITVGQRQRQQQQSLSE